MKHQLEITKGEWKSQQQKSGDMHISSKGNWINFVKVSFVHDDNTEKHRRECLHNSALICDAGNTYQSSGYLPSELLKQRDELKSTLLMVRKIAEIRGLTGIVKDCDETLKNCE